MIERLKDSIGCMVSVRDIMIGKGNARLYSTYFGKLEVEDDQYKVVVEAGGFAATILFTDDKIREVSWSCGQITIDLM